MNRQVTIVILFTLLLLYFTGCQKAETALTEESYPESTPVEVTALPGSKLFELCPAGTVKENSNAVESQLVVFRSRFTLPGGCALQLQNSVYRPEGDDFQNAVNVQAQSSFFLSYKIEKAGAPIMKCVPQNSVWIKVSAFENDKIFNEQFERLDIEAGAPKEVLYLSGYPRPFPAHKVGIRKAVCE